MTDAEAWDGEYARGGIPSSYRESPSGALEWAVKNWPLLTGLDRPATALDIGCGTGRNTCHMASAGIDVLGFDISETALDLARRRACAARFVKHDLREGLPASDASIDLATDLFVYKHLISSEVRAAYRRELARVLRPTGHVLLSVAEPDDGYYGACPEPEPGRRPRVIIDPAAGIASVLFTLEELREEFAGCFRLEMAWRKEKPGPMHGATYVRRTAASIWVKSDFK